MTWPLFLKNTLGFQCTPAMDPRDSPVCADGISYLFSAVHIGAASVVALVGILIAARFHARRGSLASRVVFGSTALLGPALIAFVVLDSPPVDFAPVMPTLALAAVVAVLAIASTGVRDRRASVVLAAIAVLVAAAGVIVEPGVGSPLLAEVTIACAASAARLRPA
jgi:hypothetical protein